MALQCPEVITLIMAKLEMAKIFVCNFEFLAFWYGNVFAIRLPSRNVCICLNFYKINILIDGVQMEKKIHYKYEQKVKFANEYFLSFQVLP